MQSERFVAQLLAGPPAASAIDVAERLLAVQAQDPRGFRLAVRARSTVLRAGEIDAVLDSGELVVGWLNRGTLHLVRREDYWWLHSLTTPQLLRDCERRLRQTGVDEAAAERGVGAIARAIADGPLLRAELRERLAAAGVPTEGQAIVHVVFLAALRGLVVRGPMKDGEQAWVDAREWLGSPPALDRNEALAELARRYLRGHGPACESDLARWARLPLRDVRRGIGAISSEIQERPGGLVALGEPVELAAPPPRLLGAFDPLLLGWADRSAVLDRVAGQQLVTDNGLFRPFALVDGRAAGIWRYRDRRVTLEPFGELAEDVVGALVADARAVEDFLAGAAAATRS